VAELNAPTPIHDECRAFRLVRPDWVKRDLDPPRPSSVAFQDRRETGAMSVYLEDEILTAGRSISELQKAWHGYWVFYLTVRQLRGDFGQIVTRDHQDSFPGHALVKDPTGKRSQGKKSKMAASSVLVSAGNGDVDAVASEMPAVLSSEPTTADIQGGSWLRFWRRWRW